MLKKSVLVNKLRRQAAESARLSALLQFCLKLLLIGHLMACAFGLVGVLQSDDVTTWIDVEKERGHTTPYSLWLAALYFCSYTLTSTGYGDVVPVSDVERGFVSCLLLLSGSIWAEILGDFTAMAAARGQREREYRSTVHEFTSVLEEVSLPPKLQYQVKNFLNSRHAGGEQLTRMRAIMQELSPNLAREISRATIGDSVRRIQFVDNCSGEFLTDIGLNLEPRAFAKEEIFGEVGNLYIMHQGLGILRAQFRMCSQGAVWGKDIILSDVKLLEEASVLALTYVEVLVLAKASLTKLLNRYPKDMEIIRWRRIRLAVHRGVVAYAAAKLKEHNLSTALFTKRADMFFNKTKMQRVPSFCLHDDALIQHLKVFNPAAARKASKESALRRSYSNNSSKSFAEGKTDEIVQIKLSIEQINGQVNSRLDVMADQIQQILDLQIQNSRPPSSASNASSESRMSSRDAPSEGGSKCGNTNGATASKNLLSKTALHDEQTEKEEKESSPDLHSEVSLSELDEIIHSPNEKNETSGEKKLSCGDMLKDIMMMHELSTVVSTDVDEKS
jgi:hypothetical protein